jgi:hypothetical protein
MPAAPLRASSAWDFGDWLGSTMVQLVADDLALHAFWLGEAADEVFGTHTDTGAINAPMSRLSSVAPGARVEIYSPAGRRVRVLMTEGRDITWNGRDDAGSLLPSGTYWCRVRSGAFSQSTRITLLR